MKYRIKNISKGLVGSLIVGTFVAITPTSSNAAAPVGTQNPLLTGATNNSLVIAQENAGTAVVASATSVASTGWNARSKGLVAKSAAASSSTGQTATVALSGVLSLYAVATTSIAVQVSGGTKAVIVPISSTKAVVIESRRATGIDSALSKSGALVYLVDSSIQSGLGPVKVFPSDLVNDPRYLNAPRALGESVTVEGVTIKVIQSDASGDTVEINR